jgi:hypothetical protein
MKRTTHIQPILAQSFTAHGGEWCFVMRFEQRTSALADVATKP